MSIPNIGEENSCLFTIDKIIPELKRLLYDKKSIVIQAPAGAGKTTRIPLALMKHPALKGKKILMLEPRRLAVKNAANWMAKSLNEKPGDRVGFRMHLDSKVSDKTIIEVITEGVLIQRLMNDEEISDIGIVIFDEFHERSVNADLGLALVLEIQEILRPELKIIVMSATLDAKPISHMLPNSALMTSEGRAFPVEIKYRGIFDSSKLIETVVTTIIDMMQQESGSILVFLPGAGEIRKVETLLTKKLSTLSFYSDEVEIAPLYGALSRSAQEKAITPAAPGKRKIVLASSIAEASITIQGIRVVIDSGLMRLSRYHPGSGMNRLITIPVSQASADQRTGRAGRTEAGICIRLWDQSQHLEPFTQPEILSADPSPLMLALANRGVMDVNSLKWLNPPSQELIDSGRKLLSLLGALDQNNRITEQGIKMSSAGVHPRLAQMVIRSYLTGQLKMASQMAALLSERDILTSSKEIPFSADMSLRLNLLQEDGFSSSESTRIALIKKSARLLEKKILEMSRNSHLHLTEKKGSIGALLAFAYPDRIGIKVSDGHYLLSGGRGAVLRKNDPLTQQDLIAAAEMDSGDQEARIYIAAPLDRKQALRELDDLIKKEEVLEFNSDLRKFKIWRESSIGRVVLKKEPLFKIEPEKFKEALTNLIKNEGFSLLDPSPSIAQYLTRLQFMHLTDKENWPDFCDQVLTSEVKQWLSPFLSSMNVNRSLKEIPLKEALQNRVQWKQIQQLDRLAPSQYQLPSGSKVPIKYKGNVAILSARIQQLFGLTSSPKLAGGRVSLTIHLLSPASRPVQITQDLESFWKNGYPEIKKELKGRYPKHYWPEDPFAAMATDRVRPKKD